MKLPDALRKYKSPGKGLKNPDEIFRNFMNQSNLGICIVDNKGKIVDWNPAMSQLFEISGDNYLNKTVWDFDFDYLPAHRKTKEEKQRIKDTVLNYLNQPIKGVFTAEFEKEVNGNVKYIQYQVFPIKTNRGYYFGRVNIDVSEKKATELELISYKQHLEELVRSRTMELKRNEAHSRLLLESIPMAYYSYEPGKRDQIWYSEQIKSLTGFSSEDLRKKPDLWMKRIHPDDLAKTEGVFNSLRKNNQRVSCEYRWIDASDQEIWILDQAVLLGETEKHSKQIIGCFMDITKRKEWESAVLESERNYREIFNNTTDAIILIHPATLAIEDVNDTMLDMFSTTFKKASSSNFDEYSAGYAPYDNVAIAKIIEKVLIEGPLQIEWLAKNDELVTFWTEINFKMVIINGEARILAIVRNIDEKKKTEQRITYQRDFEKLILTISSRFINIPYQKVDSEIEKSLEEICHFSNTAGAYLIILDENKKSYSLTHFWQNELLDIKASDFIYIPEEWSVKQADIQITNDALFVENVEELDFAEREYINLILNYKIKSFINVPLHFQNNIFGFMGLAVNKPGRKWLVEEGDLLKLTGQIFINALKRKESVRTVLTSEQTYREIYNATSEAIIVHDYSSGNILDVNNAMLDMFGYSYEEALSITFGNISSGVGEYTYHEAMKLITETVHKGPQTLEWQARRHDGSLFWAEISLKIAEINGKKRVLSVIRDTSERKLLDKKILDAVIKTEEQERERFAKNLHDDLGPLLSSIKMYIGSLNVSIDRGKQEFILAQLNEIVKEAITTTKEVSNDLSPHILNNYGLVSAIDNFIQKVPPSVKVNFESSLPSERYSNSIENAFFRIVKELINNTMKHSGAKRIDIKLEEKGQQLSLSYSDNGKGFDLQKQNSSKVKGMGISNIISRAKSLNGIYEIFSKGNMGFSFQIIVPIQQSLE